MLKLGDEVRLIKADNGIGENIIERHKKDNVICNVVVIRKSKLIPYVIMESKNSRFTGITWGVDENQIEKVEENEIPN